MPDAAHSHVYRQPGGAADSRMGDDHGSKLDSDSDESYESTIDDKDGAYDDEAEAREMDYVEVWSGHPEGGRVVEAVKEQGGAAMGIGMGTGYNLQDKDTAGEVRYRLDAYWRPRTLMLCPPCTAWGSWNRFNMAKGSFRTIKNKPKARAEARLRARGYPLAQGRQEGPKG